MLYLTCSLIPSVDLAHYRLSRVKGRLLEFRIYHNVANFGKLFLQGNK